MPNASAMSTREIVKLFEAEMGQPIKTRVVSKFMVSMIGLFVPIVREMKELAYEFEEPYVVDDSQFRAAFGDTATPLPAGVKAMVGWYEQHRNALKQAA
ncbi:MAG: hypothetical protein IPK16_05680 [Anaerolineales bacterium]|nr:hypothetical protein [Anaerolineales bacterium]